MRKSLDRQKRILVLKPLCRFSLTRLVKNCREHDRTDPSLTLPEESRSSAMPAESPRMMASDTSLAASIFKTSLIYALFTHEICKLTSARAPPGTGVPSRTATTRAPTMEKNLCTFHTKRQSRCTKPPLTTQLRRIPAARTAAAAVAWPIGRVELCPTTYRHWA